jgi:PAS domain S-box-containing protein
LNQGLVSLQLFMAVLSVMMLTLAAQVASRHRIERILNEARADLELRVEERTAELARSNWALQEEIEQRRRTEGQLSQKESQLAQAQAVGHIGSWRWDIPEDRVMWTDELYRLYGLNPKGGSIDYQTFLSHVHPDDRDMVRRTVQQSLRSLGSYSYEHRVLRPDGSIRWVRAQGQVIADENGRAARILGTAQDITHLKRAEEALRESEERFRLMVSGVKDYAIYMLDPDGRIVSWNEGAARIKGCSAGEALGRHFSMFYLPADIASGRPARDLKEAAEQGRYEAEAWRVRKDGTRFWAENLLTAIRDPSGKLRGFGKVTRDITDRRRTEEEIHRLNEDLEARVMDRTRALEEANARLRGSLSEKETLLKEIHHRVKNNLQIVYSLINLQSKNVRDPKALEGLEDCRERVRAMAMVHEKLYRSKDLARIDFRDYVAELTKGLSQTYGTRGVSVRVDADEVSLGIDEAVPCGLIVHELVSNCLKHAFPSGRGGEVVVELRREGAGQLHVTVRDDGVGFPAGMDFRSMTSLGLQLVSGLARQLGGSVRRKEGRGTAFEVVFHAAAEAAPPARAAG